MWDVTIGPRLLFPIAVNRSATTVSLLTRKVYFSAESRTIIAPSASENSTAMSNDQTNRE